MTRRNTTLFMTLIVLMVRIPMAGAQAGEPHTGSALPAIPMTPAESAATQLAQQQALATALKAIMASLSDMTEQRGDLAAVQALLGASADPQAAVLLQALAQREAALRHPEKTAAPTPAERAGQASVANTPTPSKPPPPRRKKPLVIAMAVAAADGLAGKILLPDGKVIREGQSFPHDGDRYTLDSVTPAGETVAGLHRFTVTVTRDTPRTTQQLVFPDGEPPE